MRRPRDRPRRSRRPTRRARHAGRRHRASRSATVTTPTVQRSVQRCEHCGAEFDERAALAACSTCGGLLELEHAFSAEASTLRATFAARRAAAHLPDISGVWRYRELVLPSATDDAIVSHPEGNTPLVGRATVSQWA